MPKIPLYDVLDHTNHTFSESSRSKDIYTDIPKCLIHKYTNTNTQIHKYANTAYDKVPDRPNMWYIFETRIVQGYQKLYSYLVQTWISEFRTVVRGLASQIVWWDWIFFNSSILKVLDFQQKYKTKVQKYQQPSDCLMWSLSLCVCVRIYCPTWLTLTSVQDFTTIYAGFCVLRLFS